MTLIYLKQRRQIEHDGCSKVDIGTHQSKPHYCGTTSFLSDSGALVPDARKGIGVLCDACHGPEYWQKRRVGTFLHELPVGSDRRRCSTRRYWRCRQSEIPMNPTVESHIQHLRWISETERYLARVREHTARCPDDLEAQAVIRMVDGALSKARSEIGVTACAPQRAPSEN